MYSILIITIDLPSGKKNNISSLIVDETTVKGFTDTLPVRVSECIIVQTFPNNWETKLTTITKIS